jgi:hypothetical protein
VALAIEEYEQKKAGIAAINLNTLHGLDPRSLNPKHVDGRSM